MIYSWWNGGQTQEWTLNLTYFKPSFPEFVHFEVCHSWVCHSWVCPLRSLSLLSLSTPKFVTPAFVHSEVCHSCFCPLRSLSLLSLSTPTFVTPEFVHSEVCHSCVCTEPMKHPCNEVLISTAIFEIFRGKKLTFKYYKFTLSSVLNFLRFCTFTDWQSDASFCAVYAILQIFIFFCIQSFFY